jgi:hypothetical protein
MLRLTACGKRKCSCREATALALQRLLEEDLYFCVLYAYWQRDDAFTVVEAATFGAVPALMRPVISRLARARALRNLQGQARATLHCSSQTARSLWACRLCACAQSTASCKVQALASIRTHARLCNTRCSPQAGWRVARRSASTAAAWCESADKGCGAGHGAPLVGVRPRALARGRRRARGVPRSERRPLSNRRVAVPG